MIAMIRFIYHSTIYLFSKIQYLSPPYIPMRWLFYKYTNLNLHKPTLVATLHSISEYPTNHTNIY